MITKVAKVLDRIIIGFVLAVSIVVSIKAILG